MFEPEAYGFELRRIVDIGHRAAGVAAFGTKQYLEIVGRNRTAVARAVVGLQRYRRVALAVEPCARDDIERIGAHLTAHAPLHIAPQLLVEIGLLRSHVGRVECLVHHLLRALSVGGRQLVSAVVAAAVRSYRQVGLIRRADRGVVIEPAVVAVGAARSVHRVERICHPQRGALVGVEAYRIVAHVGLGIHLAVVRDVYKAVARLAYGQLRPVAHECHRLVVHALRERQRLLRPVRERHLDPGAADIIRFVA